MAARRHRRSLLGDRRGATAVEFAVIALFAFFPLVLGILELSLMLFTQSLIDGAARDAARLIRTGQIQGVAAASAFKTALCNEAFIVPCASFVFDVENFGSFGTIAMPQWNNSGKFVDGSGNPLTPQFQPGGPGSIVAVRVLYARPFAIPMMIDYLGQGSPTAVLASTVIFQNEPFPVNGGS